MRAELTQTDINDLITKYFDPEGYSFPDGFEHRFDPYSSKILYSLVREFKPRTCVEFGTSFGGGTAVVLAALRKNRLPYWYIASELRDDIRQQTVANVYAKNLATPQFMTAIEENLDYVPEEIDFLYVDGDHDLANCQWYLENLLPRVKPGGLVVIHDWSVTKDLAYTGGDFPEIHYLIDQYKSGKLPLTRLYWTWGDEGWNGQAATSFWLKK